MSNRLLRSLIKLAPLTGAETPDAELLERFLEQRDEAAFEAIVLRHGSMVQGVCRRRLGDGPDAEDAFQAVFLVLARDARRIGNRESLAGWLYRVALLTALKIMGRNARRRFDSLPGDSVVDRLNLDEEVQTRELRVLVEQELHALPDRLRAPVVLCYLEGRSNTEAAAVLGCPRGTVDSRLATARKRLLGRLQRRGVALSAAVGLESILRSEAAAGPAFACLVEVAVRGAMKLSTAGSAAGSVPDNVLTLVDGMSTTMSISKLHLLAILTVALTLAGGGLGLVLTAADAPQEKKEPAAEAKEKAKATPKVARAEPKSEVSALSNRDVQSLLQKPAGLDEPLQVSLKEFCAYLSEKFGVPIRVDSAAFARMKIHGAVKLYEQEIHLPVVRGMSMGDALREGLAQLKSNQIPGDEIPIAFPATYRVRDGQILIVPAYVAPYVTGGRGDPEQAALLPTDLLSEQELGEPISLAIDEKPLSEVLQELRRMTGANIVLDTRAKEQAKQSVSATMNDVRLLTALRVLSDMCELKPVAMNNVYYVTTRENAERLQKELDRERFGEPMAPVPEPTPLPKVAPK